MEEHKDKKSLGQVKWLKMEMSDPDMRVDIAFEKIHVLLGRNGAGKTLSMRMVWALGYIANGMIINSKNSDLAITAFAQFVMDHSFLDQKMSGTVKVTYESGAELEVKLENGKVRTVEYVNFDEITEVIRLVYMSSEMRLFSSISLYLRIRNSKCPASDVELMTEMLAYFRIYDVSHVETLIKRCPIEIDQEVMNGLNESFGVDLKKDLEYKDGNLVFDLDKERCDFFFQAGEKRKYMCTYGSGHQAVINMTISTI